MASPTAENANPPADARPLRLLSIAHSYALAVNRRLAVAMQQRGGGRWDVTAVAPRYFHGRRDLRPVVADDADGEPITLHAINAYITKSPHLFVYGRELRKLLAEGDWDLVHMWEEPYVTAGTQITRWCPDDVPLVFRTAQSINKSYPPPFRWFERYCVRRCAGWICSGQTVADNLLQRPGYAEKPFIRVPLGVDLESFKPDPAAGQAIREKLGWSIDGPPVIGYLGRFVPEKGLHLLMRALARVKTPWRIMLCGGGLMEGELAAWQNENPDSVRVLTGVAHKDIPDYLNAMDMLVAPSQTVHFWREQFGRMLVEAFATCVPVIGSDSGEIPNVIGDSGLIVGEKDEDGWVAAIEKLLNDADLRRELGERGRSRVDEFSWATVGQRYIDFFDSLLDGTARPARETANASIAGGPGS